MNDDNNAITSSGHDWSHRILPLCRSISIAVNVCGRVVAKC